MNLEGDAWPVSWRNGKNCRRHDANHLTLQIADVQNAEILFTGPFRASKNRPLLKQLRPIEPILLRILKSCRLEISRSLFLGVFAPSPLNKIAIPPDLDVYLNKLHLLLIFNIILSVFL